jgi:DsbC/DsbD-like thiol-disulfide interchange protein
MLSAALAALTTALAPAGPAVAAEGGPVPVADAAEVGLLPGWRLADGTHMTALVVSLAPGWKTYWRAPGEGGIPPSFDWNGSSNLVSVQAHWPRPEVYVVNGMQTIGFTSELVLPLQIATADPAAPVGVAMTVELGICEDICIPVSARFRAELPAAAAAPDPRIVAALDARPLDAAAGGVRAARCEVTPIADGLRVTARIVMPDLPGAETAVFELPDPEVWIAEASARRAGDTLVAVTEMVSYAAGAMVLDRSRLRITVLAEGAAVEIEGCPAP